MVRVLRGFGGLLAMFAIASLLSSASQAGTIIRLGLGSDASPDIEFDGTTLSTFDDGVAGTTEDQNTNVDFQGLLESFATDIPTSVASVSLNGLVAAPPATVVAGTLVIQNFTGGSFILRNAANVELLSGTLGGSSIAGTLGGTGTGALFTTSFSSVNPTGTLAQYIKPNTLTLSMSFTNVLSGGASGFALAPFGIDTSKLSAFTGDVTINISAEAIPEPMSATLLFVAVSLTGLAYRTRR
jgi:hypothetical protein